MKTNTTKLKVESRKQKAALLWGGDGLPNPASRITHHASRITSPAFTLIELLVVIGIIAILAALTIPGVSAAKIAITRARAKGELKALESIIEGYHDKLGFYPPDNQLPAPNPNPWAINQLYYELLGTTNITISGTPYFQTLDGTVQIKVSDVTNAFGANVTGFMNCARDTGDGLSGGAAFVKGLKSAQYMAITNTGSPILYTVLGTSLDGPLTYGPPGTKLNPWRYNSSSPLHNPKSYDLWIDIAAGNKTNRICNWSDRYLVISNPSE